MNARIFPAAMAMILAGSLAVAQQPQQSVPDAQPSATAPARTLDPHRQVMRLSKELNLTPDQAAKLEPILADRDQKVAALRANSTLTPAAAQQQMRAIQKSSREQIGSILTPAQIAQFKAIQKSRGTGGQTVAPSTTPSA